TFLDGQLVISDRLTAHGTDLTNEGYAYDPGPDSWCLIANSNGVTYHGPSAFGGYGMGGTATGQHVALKAAGVLPDHAPCGAPELPWAAFAPAEGDLGPDGTVRVELTVDGTDQDEGETSQAYLQVRGAPDDTIVPITVVWEAGQAPVARDGN